MAEQKRAKSAQEPLPDVLLRLEALAKEGKKKPVKKQKELVTDMGGEKLMFSRTVPNGALDSRNVLHRYKPPHVREEDERRARERKQLKAQSTERSFPQYPGRRKTKLAAAREEGRVAPAPKPAPAPAPKPAREPGPAPPPKREPKAPPKLRLDVSKLPLELFDEDDTEMHTPQEWVESGCSARAPYYMGAEKGWCWLPCEVLGYDDDASKYEVRFKGVKGKGGAEPSQTKAVRRLNLLFDKESEVSHRDRVARAEMRREDRKLQMRREHFVSNFPTVDLSMMSRDTLGSIHSKVVSSLSQERRDAMEQALVPSEDEGEPTMAVRLRGLANEVTGNYKYAMQSAALQHVLENTPQHPSAKHFADAGLAPFAPRAGPPQFAKFPIPAPAIAYADAAARFAASFYGADTKTLSVVSGLCGSWVSTLGVLRYMDSNLEGLELPCELDVFCQRQEKQADAFASALEGDWHKKTFENFTDALQDKHDFYQSDVKAYTGSALWRLLKCFEMRMSDQLRASVIASLDDWLAFVEKYAITASNDAQNAKRKPRPTVVAGKIVEDEETDCVADAALRLAQIDTSGLSLAQQDEPQSPKTPGGGRVTVMFNEAATKKSSGSKPLSQKELMALAPKRMKIRKNMSEEEVAKEQARFDAEQAVFDEALDAEMARKRAARDLLPKCSSLFNQRLLVRGNKIELEPTPKAIEQALLDRLDCLVQFSQTFKCMDSELLALLRLPAKVLYDVKKCRTNDKVIFVRTAIRDLVQSAMRGPEKLANDYAAMVGVMEIDANSFVETFVASKTPRPTPADFQAEIERLNVIMESVPILSFDEELFGLVSIDTTAAKHDLFAKAKTLRDALLNQLVSDLKKQTVSVHDRYREIQRKLNIKPTDEFQLQELKDFVESSKVEVESLKAEVEQIHSSYSMLDDYHFLAPDEEVCDAWRCMEWPVTLVEDYESAEDTIELDKNRMLDALTKEKEAFEALMESLEKQALEFRQYGGSENVQKYYDEATTLSDQIRNAKEQGELFNKRDEMLGFPRTEYAMLNQIERDFAPFLKLWTMCQDFADAKVEWLNGPLLKLDYLDVEKQVTDWWRTSFKLSKQFAEDFPHCSEVALFLRAQTDDFKAYLPIIQALASDALRVRHWAKLSEDLSKSTGKDVELDGSDEMTLNDLVEMELLEQMETIQMTSVSAEKEYSLEKAMKAMQQEWDEMCFDYLAYKETGTHIVKGVDDIIALLDDHVVKTQTMRGSPFIKPIATEAGNWEHKLHESQAILDEWIMCQKTWLYLQPIFDSDDIMRQMPTEGRRFQAVDAMWRKNMAATVDDPNFMRCTGREKLLEKFKQANQKLDEIQKGLNDYLETKRIAFSRFFFLSNDELLEILSQTKDPLLVQPHLGKCFEGVAKCTFENGAEDLVQVISQEGEKVTLVDPIHPLQGKNKGNVENWMTELEQSCWDTIKHTSFACMDAYATTLGCGAHIYHTQEGGTLDIILGHSPGDITKDTGHTREMWMIEWPAMLVLAVSQIYWTRATWNVLRTQGEKGLHDYYEFLDEQLARIVQRVRGKLNKIERKTIGALVVMDVHARDTTKKMEHAKVDRDDHFEWMSQLRYYWEPADGTYPHQDNLNSRIGDHFIMARIVNAEIAYGYEYLGNSMRLVVTPLTDRCYRTMMGAVGLNYGGAPEGPAGTGKTETVKDLAKAVALQCVVFNCSDGLDYLAMGKFFKGLAACGAWSCFDEFNRINIEVLSVIAQQILEINVGKKNMQIENAKKGGGFHEFKFHFEGSYIKLNPNANPFITMNPGYAGRAELPDNLKALFRPCAMMVPDYAMIGEIMLYSFGFSDAKNNARKLVQVLQLSSEQLSSQRHYDYGMRAVFSILVAAGQLRLSLGDDPDWSENRITLRAIRDVNLPKFLEGDLPLFSGITSDLFPGVELSASDHGTLIPSIKDVCRRGFWIHCGADGMQIKSTEPNPDNILQIDGPGGEEFVHKCVQLYETHLVRHSLMLVGPTMGGKTNIFMALGTAMSLANERGDPKLEKVRLTVINPKSIHPNYLYGNFDENTHEWSDGILAIQFRNMSKDTDADGNFVDRNWLLFDGPVDAVWIENMNTVMDENKKLCLMSGEIIKMSAMTRMMFEPEDLEVASPATVSRNGIVFCEPSKLGWAVLVDSWIEVKMPKLGCGEGSMDDKKDFVRGLFNWLVPPCLFAALRLCKKPVPVTELELVASLMNLLDCFWDLHETGIGSDKEKALEALFLQAVVWSIGACVDQKTRVTFDHMARITFNGTVSGDQYFADFLNKTPGYQGKDSNGEQRACLGPIPPADVGLIYDFVYDGKKLQWKNWTDSAERFHIDRDAEYTSILVPNIDTIRGDALLETLLIHKHHVMFSGETGTGKSVAVKKKLLTGMPDGFTTIFLNFSAATKAGAVMDIIDGKMTKRRKGYYGPPPGKTAVIFVDDLNMPAKEEFGAQPPIEILRQFMDHKSWWDLKEFFLRNIIDTQFVAAMGPPGGGRNHITQRYIRHYNLVTMVPFSDDALETVFVTIMQWFLASFPGAVKGVASAVVDASIHFYHKIAAELLPTPSKSHYTFNLRDLSKIFQGMTQSSSDDIKSAPDLIRIWCHENFRVFSDRLVDDTDRAWFTKTLAEQVKEDFKMEYSKVRGPNEVLLYANFTDPKASTKRYMEVIDREGLGKVMDGYLDDYNMIARTPMKLVLFFNAIEHIARISRVIQLPFGNALLVGVGGSGRRSVTTLATSIAEYEMFEIQITKTYGRVEWFDDLKTIMWMSGRDNKPTVFLFSDTQIKEEAFLEDINGILNTGEVANLFAMDEYMALMEDIAEDAAEAGCTTEADKWAFFVQRVRNNLHLVLAFSPIGDAFRRRLRMFPAFVNCCTIDWFTEWPEDALRQVAKYFLNDVELETKVKAACIDVCVDMQNRVSLMSADFLDRMRRNYYVTPTSYLSLISTFKDLLGAQREKVLTAKHRYDNGLSKLAETEAQVDGMREELTALQPKLVVATKETDELIENVKAAQIVAEETKVKVQADEKVCAGQAEEANEMKASCEAELAEAIPALNAAVKALKTLSKGDIVEVKAMKKPPDGVKLTMECVCHMMGVKPQMIKDPDGGTKKVADYWVPAQKNLLSDSRFLENLFAYDKDNIPEKIVEKVTPYTENPLFDPDKVKKASVAAAGLCKWVHAMIIYDRVAKVVAPKKAALAQAMNDLATANAALKGKQDELQALMDKLAGLQEQLDAAMAKKDDLANQVDQCAKRLDRAASLIDGLGGEKVRWNQLSNELQATYDNVTGDILLAAGVIAYLGAFTASYRDDATSQWASILHAQNISCAEKFSLSETLGEPVKIREWTIQKLPNDGFSIDNAIMLERSARWPLMIDPQGQANRWIKNREADHKLQVCKQNQATFVRTVENAIAFGQPVLLENVPEVLDPILESVLLKSVVTVGGISTIKLGDNTVEWDPNFRFYITTKMPNPHYSPETCVKVNLLNFMATAEGLQDQMQGIVVAKEKPELEKKREELVLEDAANKKQLKEIEDLILKLLKEAEGNILDDEVLINTLSESKKTANDIEIKVKAAVKTNEKIQKVREEYVPVAFRVANLFFCIADLCSVDPMYQYSLEWYVQLFLLAIGKAPPAASMDERVVSLNDTFTYTLYANICRSLFAKDKLLFSFLLCCKIELGNGAMDGGELRYLLAGNTAMKLRVANPDAGTGSWLTDKLWGEVLALETLPAFEGFSEEFLSKREEYRKILFCEEAREPIYAVSPDRTEFQKLCLIRALRPDDVVPNVELFVKHEMGTRFIEPPPFDLSASYADSNCASPLIFVLSPGADPMSELLKLAEDLGVPTSKLFIISLGQGQGPIAENAVEEAVDKGTWVALQNCHLFESWMPTLERMCEEITPETAHPEFRLWLTSMPSKAFPVYVLQNGVKMVNEPPKGLRANVLGNYQTFTKEFVEDSCPARTNEWKKMLFALCFFHATVIERRKYGPLGWNIAYVFTTPDLDISREQLKIFLNSLRDDDPVPYAALAYLAGECNYGGRVTDDKDRRLILNILGDFYCDALQHDEYKFSASGTYFAPASMDYDGYIEYIKGLPYQDAPEAFGMHANANITCAMKETRALLGTALALQPRESGGAGMSWADTVKEAASGIEKTLPAQFDYDQCVIDFPIKYDESMNTVLSQEMIRFNNMTEVIKRSLADVQKATMGLVVLSVELEAMGDSMVNGQVPDMWMSIAYPSRMPLGSWSADLVARLKFLQDWFESKSYPSTYWLSGFFFTQAFLTGTKQNYARRQHLPIDECQYETNVLTVEEEAKSKEAGPEHGAYIWGLFLDGALWDRKTHALQESNPKELFVPIPSMHLLPMHHSELEGVKDSDVGGTAHKYIAPCYKTSVRFGVLSTTGHSTNFVMMFRIPMDPKHNQRHWIKRGLAMLTSLDD